MSPLSRPASFSRHVALAVVGGLAFFLAACSPTLNWREVRADTSTLRFLLPCKPDKAQKQVPLGPSEVQLNMLGCDAGGATFAVAWAELAPGADKAAVLSQWERLTLQNMQASAPAESQPMKVVGADSNPPPRQLAATGRTADGKVVFGRTAYFSSGSQIFQAVMYAPKSAPDAADTFFSSLRLQ